jgi:hypothetical protein
LAVVLRFVAAALRCAERAAGVVVLRVVLVLALVLVFSAILLLIPLR